MKVNEIAFTCYNVSDLKASREFYEQVLGLKPTNVWEDGKSGFVEYDIGNGTFAIGAGSESSRPSKDGATIALEVDDFDDAIKTLKEKNAKFRLEPIDSTVCHMAIIDDPDGSAIIIHKRKNKSIPV